MGNKIKGINFAEKARKAFVRGARIMCRARLQLFTSSCCGGGGKDEKVKAPVDQVVQERRR